MITITGISRRIGDLKILDNIDLEIRKGEIFTLIGPSGSGKTSLLRLLDLLDLPTTGAIAINGSSTDGSAQDRLMLRRKMAMVFQNPAVLNSTVEENVASGLKFRKIPDREISREVAGALNLVKLSHLTGRRAVTLSGGEMQRLAIARAIVTKPDIMFLDEPTANLDPANSEMIEDLILGINKKFSTTIVLSTHDLIQGQRLAHRIGVIMDGRLVQAGNLDAVFYHPVNRAVASFVGIEAIRGGVVENSENGLATIAVGGVRIQAITKERPGARVALCIRPEDVTLGLPGASPSHGSARNFLQGTIKKMVPVGPYTRITADYSGMLLNAVLTGKSCGDLNISCGSAVTASVKATAIHVIPDD